MKTDFHNKEFALSLDLQVEVNSEMAYSVGNSKTELLVISQLGELLIPARGSADGLIYVHMQLNYAITCHVHASSRSPSNKGKNPPKSKGDGVLVNNLLIVGGL